MTAAIATTWFSSDLFRAAVYLVVTVVVAKVVDMVLARHGGGLTRVLSRRELTRAEKTRLRMGRRIVVVAIMFLGVALALFQIPQVGTLARAMLASAGITAVVVGFAARSVLANPIAGIVIAISQPVRIGDYVSIDDVSGTVEEIGLSYTYIRAADNRRVVIPNEQLSSKVVHNYTIVEQASAAMVDFSVPPVAALADISRVALEEAARFTRGEDGREPTLTVLEIAFDQVRLRITLWAADRPTAESVAATLRGALMERLESEGLLAPAAPGS